MQSAASSKFTTYQNVQIFRTINELIYFYFNAFKDKEQQN